LFFNKISSFRSSTFSIIMSLSARRDLPCGRDILNRKIISKINKVWTEIAAELKNTSANIYDDTTTDTKSEQN